MTVFTNDQSLKTTHAIENSSYSPWILSTVQVILASCLIGICSQIKIPLYFTPVPLIITNTSILLISALLGYKKGFLAVLGYLAQGFIGLPVWAGGAAGGVAYFMGPTGGYLAGYLILSLICGFFLNRSSSQSFFKMMIVFFVATFVQLGMGSLWLSQFVGINNCFMLGFFPFIITDAAKAFFAACALKYCQK